MCSDPTLPAGIAIRYGNKRYLLCADEVTNFLSNCDSMGLCSPQEIAEQLTLISDIVLDSTGVGADQVKLSMKLLRELSLATLSALSSDSPVLA